MIRPKIKVRMPTFHFSENELNTLIAGWNYEARQPFPYADAYDPGSHPEQVARGREVFAGAQCKSCHAESAADLNREGVNAPNLELARRRLKPAWLSQWLTDPQAMAPGVNMPKFPWESIAHPADPNETSEQRVEAIKTYVMSIGK
jgi:cytochrome c2